MVNKFTFDGHVFLFVFSSLVMKKCCLFVFVQFCVLLCFSGVTNADKYVDSVFNSLSEEERIAQLMVIAAKSLGDPTHEKELMEIIKMYNVGGLIFFQGTPTRHAQLVNRYQQMAKTPLMIFMDAEWGVGMRLDSAIDLPYQIMLGAMQSGSLVYDYAKIVAQQCKRLGIHFNLAPVMDVNNNPKNPVIGYRSFGEDVQKVSEYGVHYINGLQDNNIYASAKHFPGHGDVSTDSHEDLPVLLKTQEDLEKLEMRPFQAAIENGNVKSVLVAHLSLPKIVNRRKTPSTISSEIIKGMLVNDLEFNGLVITDALNMKGLRRFVEDDEVALKTLKAGNDLLCMPDNIQFAILSVRKEMSINPDFKKEIYAKVKKMLYAKYDLKVHEFTPIATNNITEDINKWSSTNFLSQLVKNSATLVRLEDKNLFKKTYKKIVYISIGEKLPNRLSFLLNQYAPIEYLELEKEDSKRDAKDIYDFYKNQTGSILFLIGVHNYSNSVSNDFGMTKQNEFLIDKFSLLPNSLIVFFGNPYVLKKFPNAVNVLMMYHNSFESQTAVVDMIKEEGYPKGVLPISIDENTLYGSGLSSFELLLQEKQNAQQDASFSAIDSIVNKSIQEKIFPGCQIMATQKGKVIYQKNFGNYTYSDNEKVTTKSIYDIASLTKVFATTLAVMKLYDEGKIKLSDPISKFLPELKNTDKQKITIKELLSHQSGLISWIPFYKETLDDNGNPLSNIYSKTKSYPFTIPIAKNLYMHYAWKDSLLQVIIRSKLDENKKYVYSDLGFILLAQVIEKITNIPLEDYVQTHFYEPLGLANTFVNPMGKRILSDIVPTEDEDVFRKQVVRGYVHDYTAAMLGGFTGNAGLFSNATDLALLCELFLQEGTLGKKNLLKPQTIKLFTSYVNKTSRRGLGFDKPEQEKSITYPSQYASPQTFGHTGFTGTCAWIDPNFDLTFVFLSNRIYPSSENKKIQNQKIREQILDVIYKKLLPSKSDILPHKGTKHHAKK